MYVKALKKKSSPNNVINYRRQRNKFAGHQANLFFLFWIYSPPPTWVIYCLICLQNSISPPLPVVCLKIWRAPNLNLLIVENFKLASRITGFQEDQNNAQHFERHYSR